MPRRFELVGDIMPNWEPAAEGFGALVTHGWATPAKTRKKCCYGQKKKLGQYSSLPLSPLISHAQRTSPFRKQSVKDLYFYKEVHSFVIEVVHYRLMTFPQVHVYFYMYTCICMWQYNSNHKCNLSRNDVKSKNVRIKDYRKFIRHRLDGEILLVKHAY